MAWWGVKRTAADIDGLPFVAAEAGLRAGFRICANKPHNREVGPRDYTRRVTLDCSARMRSARVLICSSAEPALSRTPPPFAP
jgi:hypothetical protein